MFSSGGFVTKTKNGVTDQGFKITFRKCNFCKHATFLNKNRTNFMQALRFAACHFFKCNCKQNQIRNWNIDMDKFISYWKGFPDFKKKVSSVVGLVYGIAFFMCKSEFILGQNVSVEKEKSLLKKHFPTEAFSTET